MPNQPKVPNNNRTIRIAGPLWLASLKAAPERPEGHASEAIREFLGFYTSVPTKLWRAACVRAAKHDESIWDVLHRALTDYTRG